MLGRRGFALEGIVARICRDAGGRLRTSVFVRDMDLFGLGVAGSRGWKWSWIVCHCEEELISQWTPRCVQTRRNVALTDGVVENC